MINKLIESIKDNDTDTLRNLISQYNIDSEDIPVINSVLAFFDSMFEDDEENTYYFSLRYSTGGSLVYTTVSNGIISAIEEVYGLEDMDPELQLNTDINITDAKEILDKLIHEKSRDLMLKEDKEDTE